MANYISLPSGTNTTGSALGVAIGGLAVSYLSSAAFMVAAATAVGVPPIALAGVAGVLITGLANWAVTHIAEVKNLNDLVAALPKSYDADPENKLR